jgi:hypothetical protein
MNHSSGFPLSAFRFPLSAFRFPLPSRPPSSRCHPENRVVCGLKDLSRNPSAAMRHYSRFQLLTFDF